MAREIRIGDEVWVHGYVDEIRKDCIIIRNNGGYFGTIEGEIVIADTPQTDDKDTNVLNKPQTDCETCKHYGVVSVSCDRCDKSAHSKYEPQTDAVFYDYEPNADNIRHLGWNGRIVDGKRTDE